MEFKMTKRSMNAIEAQSEHTLDDFFSLMLDLMRDFRKETGKDVSDLEVTDNAVKKWMTVVRPMLNINLDSASGELMETHGDLISDLNSKIRAKEAQTESMSVNIAESDKLIQGLRSRLEELETESRETMSRQEIISDYQAKISDIEQKIGSMQNVSIDDKIAEYNSLSNEYASLKRKFEAADENIEKEKEKLTQLSAEMSQKEPLLTAAENDVKAKSSELFKVQAELQRLENELQQAEKENSEAQIRIQSLEGLFSEAKNNLEEKRNLLSVKREMNKSLNEEIQQVSDDIASAESDIFEREAELETVKSLYNEKNQSAEALSGEISELKGEISQLEEKFMQMGSEKQVLIQNIESKKQSLKDADADELREQIAKLDLQIEQLQAENDEIRKNIEGKTLVLDGLCQEKSVLEQNKEEIENEFTQISTEKQNLQSENAMQAAKLKSLKNELAEYKRIYSPEYAESVKNEIESIRMSLRVYQECTLNLFGDDIPADYVGEKITQELERKKSVLDMQLSELNKKLVALKADYIDVISETERKVNIYDVM